VLTPKVGNEDIGRVTGGRHRYILKILTGVIMKKWRHWLHSCEPTGRRWRTYIPDHECCVIVVVKPEVMNAVYFENRHSVW